MFIYDLPDDILLEVLLSLSVLDILSLKQVGYVVSEIFRWLTNICHNRGM